MTYHLDGGGYALDGGGYATLPVSSIPAARGALEGFEHNDLTGEYAGDTGSFNIETANPKADTYNLDSDTENENKMIYRTGADGVVYPTHTYEWWQYQFNGTIGGLFFFVQDSTTDMSDVSGYLVRLDYGSTDEFEIRRYDSGTATSLTTDTTIGNNQTVYNRVTFTIDESGNMEANYYEGADSVATSTLTVTDTTYTDGRYGWHQAQAGIDYDSLRED